MANQALLNDDIFTLLGLGNLPEDQKLKLLAQISELVLKRVCLRVMDEFKDRDEDTKKKVEDIFTNGTDDQKLQFIQDNMDFAEVMKDELIKVKEDLTSDLKASGLLVQK